MRITDHIGDKQPGESDFKNVRFCIMFTLLRKFKKTIIQATSFSVLTFVTISLHGDVRKVQIEFS